MRDLRRLGLIVRMDVALVGALCLMSTVSMNSMERTWEIGVMWSICVTPNNIRKLVMAEGLITALLNILIAFSLSLPLSFYTGVEPISIFELRYESRRPLLNFIGGPQ